MGHTLQKFYNAFGGLDTRSNKLQMEPTTFRAGTKNNRYNFQDEMQNANGNQHKALASGFTNVGDVEYKFTDPNTGAEKYELLCVGSDGKLYKKHSHKLKFSSLGTATSYSFYYDEVDDTFKFKLNSYAEILVTQTMTMEELRDAINLQGAVCELVDDEGVTLTGSDLVAYYMDVVIGKALTVGIIEEASSWFWESIYYPSEDNFSTALPFPITASHNAAANYEGISFVNLNNSCYITDGGFPMKYDGKAVYRAGMPKILRPGISGGGSLTSYSTNLSGGDIEPVTVTPDDPESTGLTKNSTYKYVYQFGYVDYQGSEILGAYEVFTDSLYLTEALGTNNAIRFDHWAINQARNFPVFACVIDGDQNIPDVGGVINVGSEHNITPGMVLRIPIKNNGNYGHSYMLSTVTAVTTTTITVNFGYSSFGAGYNPRRKLQFLQGTVTLGSDTLAALTISTSGNFTSGSAVAILPSTANMQVGDILSSGSIPGGTKIVSIDSATQITMSFQATATSTGTALNVNYGVRAVVGAQVTSGPFPAGTTVVAVATNGASITLSQNATGAGVYAIGFLNYPYLLTNGQIVNGGFVRDELKNTVTNQNYINPYCPEIPVGAFCRVFRTVANGETPYRLIDLPLNNLGLPARFIDAIPDTGTASMAGLSRIALMDSDQGADLPRACKYLTVWQDQLVQAGRPVDPTLKDQPYPSCVLTVVENSWGFPSTDYMGYIYSESHLCDDQSIYWAESGSPEGFPQDGLHEFLIKTKYNDKVKGMAENKDSLFAFKEKSTGVIVGSLAENELSLEILEADVGLANHRTIQEVRGTLVWLDPVNGFYSCVAGRLPENIGHRISDYQKINEMGLDFNRAVAANFRNQSLYICSVGSTTFVYDYAPIGNKIRDSWYIWDRINVKSMLATSDGQMLFNDGAYTWKMKVTNTRFDFTDHTSVIDMVWNTAWLNVGSPTVDKTWSRLWVNSIQGGFDLDFYQYGNYMDSPIASLLDVEFPAEDAAKTTVKMEYKAAIPKLSAISFGMQNNSKNQFVRIQGFEVEAAASYDSGEPKR